MNKVMSYASSIGGGRDNTAASYWATIGGGYSNTVDGVGAVVAGGVSNTVRASHGAVLGGSFNLAAGVSAAVAGGKHNRILGAFANVGGGKQNYIGAFYGTVCGGLQNTVVGLHASIGGGTWNQASGNASTVSGGLMNLAMGNGSSIAGGSFNTAMGEHSFSVGFNASSRHSRSAVLAFGSNAGCRSVGPSTVAICADNGIFVNGQRVDNISSVVWHNRAALEVLTLNTSHHREYIRSLDNAVASLASIADSALLLNAELQSNVTTNGWLIRDLGASIKTVGANISSLGSDVTMVERVVHVVDTSVATLTMNVSSLAHAVDSIGETLHDITGDVAQVEVLNTEVGLLRMNVSSLRHGIQQMQVLGNDNIQLWANASSQSRLLHDIISRLEAVNVSTMAHLQTAVARQASAMRDVNKTAVVNKNDIDALWLTLNDRDTDMNRIHSTNHVQDASIAALNAMNLEQQAIIEQLNATNNEQAIELRSLRAAHHAMNATLHALTLDIERRFQATTFASIGERDDDSVTAILDCSTAIGPCTIPIATENVAATSSSAMPAVAVPPHAPTITVNLCYQFPCDPSAVDVWAWEQEIIVVVQAEDGGYFHNVTLALQTSNGVVVWLKTDGGISSFVPKDVGVSAATAYELHVSVSGVGVSSSAVVRDLVFAAPPALHNISVQLHGGSAALTSFDIIVNATDVVELSYEYWLSDQNQQWSYLAAVGSHNVTVDVPSTRDFVLKVVVTNTYGSSSACESCPLLSAALKQNASDVVANAMALATRTPSAMISSIDAGGNLLDVLALFESSMNASEVSVQVVILSELVRHGVTDGVLSFLGALQPQMEHADAGSVSLYVTAMDQYAATLEAKDKPLEGVSTLDEYLESVCAAQEAGTIPDGSATAFDGQSYSFSCASSLGAVSVEAGAVQFITSVGRVSTVTVTAWNSTLNGTLNGTNLLSNVHGVHVTDGEGALAESVDVEGGHTIAISGMVFAEVVRKSAACQYYDVHAQQWSERGVFLRGLAFADSMRAPVAMCATSHLTLFAVADEFASVKVLEDKVNKLVQRVSAINAVNLLGSEAVMNWPILGTFAFVTGAFALTVAIAKRAGRPSAIEAGRRVFRKFGELKRPEVMSSLEHEALLRRWIGGRRAATMLLLEVLTTNPFLALLFHWEHEAIVFGRADKAVTLYGAVLMTFISSAFLFDPDDTGTADFALTLWSVLVSAGLANVLLLPLQYILPYMVSNVNSLSTFTRVPMNLLEREWAKLKRPFSCQRRRKVAKCHEGCAQAQVVLHWLTLSSQRRNATRLGSDDSPIPLDAVPTELKLFNCTVKVHTTGPAIGDKHRDALDQVAVTSEIEKAIRNFQRHIKHSLVRRNAARDTEFNAWYHQLRRERRALGSLSAGVLVILTSFTLLMCLLLSGAFEERETLLWLEDVGKSIAMQTFVTDPALGLVLLLLKLFTNWLLLRAATRRVKAQLAKKQAALDARKARALDEFEVAAAKSAALHVVAAADPEAIRTEKQHKESLKAKYKLSLQDIAIAKIELTAIQGFATRRRQGDTAPLASQKADLDNRDMQARRALRAIEAALEVLNSHPDDANDELRDAQLVLTRLQARLDKIEHAKWHLRQKQARLNREGKTAHHNVRARTSPTKGSVVVPLVSLSAGEEPSADRETLVVGMRSNRRANYPPANTLSGGHRRRGTRPMARSVQSTVHRTKTGVLRLPAKSGARETQKLGRKMTWAEVTALQAKLRASAKAQNVVARRERRSRHSSRKALKALSEYRARRQRARLQRQAEQRSIAAAPASAQS